MAFLLNFVGMIVFVAGLGWLATSLGLAQVYVLPAALVLLALGVVMAIARMRAS